MQRNLFLLLAALVIYANSASATNVIEASIPNASIVGHGTLSYVLWDVYEATLYAPQGRWSPNRPFALSIKYHCAIDGKDIADRSVEEIRKQGFSDEIKLATWNEQMKSIFPDVKNGTILSAVYIPGKQTIFYEGDEPIGTIKGDDFGKLFFGIWLSEKTSEPDLRRALLGKS
jgi:hypothetical protein